MKFSLIILFILF